MENTKDVNKSYNQIQEKIKEYNSKVDELIGVFDKNVEYYNEQVQNDEERTKVLIENMDKLVEKINEIGSLEMSNLSDNIDQNIDSNFELSTLDSTKIRDIYLSDIENTMQNKLNNVKSGTCILSPFRESCYIQDKIYLDKSVTIPIENRDVLTLEFGCYYQQISHDNTDGAKTLDDCDKSKVIKRYIKGIIIFYNLKENPQYSIYCTMPDNNIFGDKNISSGPEFDISAVITNNVSEKFINIIFNSFNPYRFNYKINQDNSIKYYDVYDPNVADKEYFFGVDIYIRSMDPSIIINSEQIKIGGDATYIFKNFILKPCENGFLQYINFDTKNPNVVSNKNNRKYTFYTDGFDSNRTNETVPFNMEKCINYMNKYVEDVYSDTNDTTEFKINNFAFKEKDIYISTTHGVFRYNLELDEIVCITKEYDEGIELWNNRFGDSTRRHGYLNVGIRNNKLVTYNNDTKAFIFGNSFKFDNSSVVKAALSVNSQNLYMDLDTLFAKDDIEMIFDNNTVILSSKSGNGENPPLYYYVYDYITNSSFKSYSTPDGFLNGNFISLESNCMYKESDDILSFRGNSSIVRFKINETIISKIDTRNDVSQITDSVNINNFTDTTSITGVVNKDYIVRELNGDRFLCISPNKCGILGSVTHYAVKSIGDIKTEITKILQNEKDNAKLRNDNNPIPYKITGNFKIKNHDRYDAVYKEIGSYGFTKNDYNIYVTNIGTFLVNKADNTKCYWAGDFLRVKNESDEVVITSDRIAKYNQKNKYENLRFDFLNIPVGFKEFVSEYADPSYYDFNEYTSDDLNKIYHGIVIIGNDSRYYYIGYEPVNFEDYHNGDKLNNFNINPILINSFDLYDRFNKININSNSHIESHVSDTYGTEYNISGPVDGLLSNIKYTESKIPVNLNLNIKNVTNVITNRYKTYVLTDQKIFGTYEDNIKYQNNTYENAIGFKKERIKDYFYLMEMQDVPFKSGDIRKLLIDDFCTYVLTNNNELYMCGNNELKNIPTKDSIVYEFQLFESDVLDIWLSDSSLIIKKIEEDEEGNGISKYYTINNSNSSILGVTPAATNAKSTKFKEITSLRNKEIVYYKRENSKCFVVDLEGNVYATGDNSNKLLGISGVDSLKEFKLAFDNTDRNYTFIDIKMTDINTVIRFKDENNETRFYITGLIGLESFNEFKYYDFGVSDYKVSNLFAFNDKGYLSCLYNESTNSYFIKKYKNEEMCIINGIPEKIIELDSAYYILSNTVLYKYNYNSNELIKIMDNVYDFFYETEVIKIIRTDLSYGCIVLNDTMDVFNELNFENNFELTKELDSGNVSLKCNENETITEDPSTEDDPNLGPEQTTVLHDTKEDLLVDVVKLTVEVRNKPSDSIRDFIMVEFNDLIFKLPFGLATDIYLPIYDTLIPSESYSINFKYETENGMESYTSITDVKEPRYYKVKYSNHASGIIIRNFSEMIVPRIVYDVKSLYIEAYYGFDNGNDGNRNLCLFKPIYDTGYNYPILDTVTKLKENTNIFNIKSVKRSDEILPDWKIFDKRSDYAASIELEIYPGTTEKFISNEVFVKGKYNTDEDMNKIISYLK